MRTSALLPEKPCAANLGRALIGLSVSASALFIRIKTCQRVSWEGLSGYVISEDFSVQVKHFNKEHTIGTHHHHLIAWRQHHVQCGPGGAVENAFCAQQRRGSNVPACPNLHFAIACRLVQVSKPRSASLQQHRWRPWSPRVEPTSVCTCGEAN